ncbi:hypothetical protein EHS25_006060 [Saitozyma podzolica]|uniref:carnosine N-methyltransferase n=1 Tax=Saitozyma podzolica TaxID=1890683 RepID=A0A427XTJ0_9TREE|nr:hypothetical protein EHS25_006060 [Saitozyma podzolica]
MADSVEERAHWRSVLKAFDGYMQYHLSANHARRMAFLSLPKESKTLYEELGYREKLDAVDEGIRRNAEFIDEMIADPVFADMLADPGPEAEQSDDAAPNSHLHSHDHAGGPSHSHSQPHTHTHSQSHTHSHSLPQPHAHSHSQPHPQAHSHTTTPTPTSSSSPRPRSSQGENDLAQDKVRSTLRSFVRDWSVEGASERKACYDPCLEALERHFRVVPGGRDRGEVKVLVPGCGLGRLAMEIAARGFASQGNEFSTYMLLASHFVLNQTTRANSHFIHPFLHSFSNHPSTLHLLRRVGIPDVCPSDVLGEGRGGAFSLVAGDFEEVYGPEHWEAGTPAEGDEEGQGQRGRWGGVVTCFFMDCARNVLNYLRIIHTLLEDGGIWINIGPLLWHFENAPTNSAKGEGSIELSLDEVKDLARIVGFEIHDEKSVATTYTGIPESMLRHEYQAAFWTATKRKVKD